MISLGKLRPNKQVKRRSSSLPCDVVPTKRPRGRPRKLLQQSPSTLPSGTSSSTPGPTTQSRKDKRQGVRARKLCHLEKLPTELLQYIFLESMNVALPLCSRQLLVSLSSERLQFEITYRILYLHAGEFGPVHRGRFVSSRFFTWPFLLRYTQFALKKGISTKHGHYRTIKLSTSKDDDIAMKEYETYLHSLCEDHLADDQGCLLLNHSIMFEENFPEFKISLPHLSGLRKLVIPEKLLHGPWSEDSIRFLRLLIMGWGTIDWTGSSAGEVATQGAFDAIRCNNVEILTYLVNADCIAVKPTQEMLRTAIMEVDCDLTAVYQILISNRQRDLDLMDPEIWSWIEEGKKRHDPVASELKELLLDPQNGKVGYHVQYWSAFGNVRIEESDYITDYYEEESE